jgi:hypothetical protein
MHTNRRIAMAALDLKKDLKHLYAPAKTPSIVEVPAMSFLMIDGRGDPRAESYKEVVGTLFGVAYAVKFHVKKAQGIDFGVMPLEGRWWVQENTELDFESRDNWMWTLMIMQPAMVTAEIVDQCRAEVQKKKGLSALPPVRLETFTEGLVGQVLYTGPFADEMPTIERLHDYILAQGGALTGKHHEIYLSDFNRTAPEKLRTILRQPLQMPINEPA